MTAFLEEAAMPNDVFGSVDLRAFARFALSFYSVMFSLGTVRINSVCCSRDSTLRIYTQSETSSTLNRLD